MSMRGSHLPYMSKEHDKITLLLLETFLGGLSAGRFYLGMHNTAIAKILLLITAQTLLLIGGARALKSLDLGLPDELTLGNVFRRFFSLDVSDIQHYADQILYDESINGKNFLIAGAFFMLVYSCWHFLDMVWVHMNSVSEGPFIPLNSGMLWRPSERWNPTARTLSTLFFTSVILSSPLVTYLIYRIVDALS